MSRGHGGFLGVGDCGADAGAGSNGGGGGSGGGRSLSQLGGGGSACLSLMRPRGFRRAHLVPR